MKTKKRDEDKVYLLCGDSAPLSKVIASRDNHRNRLLYYDQEKNQSRALRYARNQKSPFVDEQDDNVILEPVIFDDGVLRVPRENPMLQQFLSLHPGNKANGGGVFYEHNPEEEAKKETERLFIEADAMAIARDLDVNKMLAIGRVYLDSDVDNMTSSELKRDILIFAKRYPSTFMEAINDPDLNISNIAARAFDEDYVRMRNNKDIYYNLEDNKKKICTVPYGENPTDVLMTWLHSDDGVWFYKYLSNKFDQE